jgi:hypothetical protein
MSRRVRYWLSYLPTVLILAALLTAVGGFIYAIATRAYHPGYYK